VRPTPATALGALAALALLTGCAATTPGPTSPAPSITTRGVGTVRGAPDTMTVVLGVQTRAASAAQALTDNDDRAAGLLDVLRGRGVADADLRTSGLTISPTFDQTGAVTGYEVDNEVTATLRDVARAGDLLDAAARSAGDAARIRQISFALDDDAQPRAQARADAVRQARDQARQLAEAAEVSLGPILSITEVAAGAPPVPVADARAAASVPIEPGTQEVSVTVEVVHAVAR
jgi:uncharacterized protein YggE